MNHYLIKHVWTDDNNIYAETNNGWIASYPFAQWPRLANATTKQRQSFTLSTFGIHWPDIDEDLSFLGLFTDAGYHINNDTAIYYQP